MRRICIVAATILLIGSWFISQVVAQEIINDRLFLTERKTQFNPIPVQGGPAGTFTVTATFQNSSADNLADLAFQVAQVTGGNLLLNADGGPGGFGSILTVPLPLTGDYSDGVLSPGQSFADIKIPGDKFTVAFKMGLASRNKFAFFVNVLGVAEPLLLSFAPEDIREFLKANTTINSAATFLERLPKEYKQHWIMITRTESVQKGTATEPRLLLPSRDSSTVFGFCTGQPCRADKGIMVDVIEHIQFDQSKNNFRFTDISFPEGKAEVDIGPPNGTGPPLCKACHGQNPRPNWDTYDNWANMLPFNRDRIYKGSQEEEAFIRLLEHLQNDPLVKQLKLPEGVTRDPVRGLITITPDDTDAGGEKTVSYAEENGLPKYTGCNPMTDAGCKGVPVTQGGRFLTLHHSAKGATSDEGRGVALFDQFSGYNAKRVAQELLDFLNDPKVNPKKVDIRPIALAIARGNCEVASNLNDFASERAQTAFRMYHRVSSFAALLTNTAAARRSLPQNKANLQAQNLKGLIEANNAFPPAPPDPFAGSVDPNADNITKGIAQRSLEQRHVAQGAELDDELTKFMIEREDEGNETTIALFRFFLEPWNMNVQKWSMGVISRSETYTFADVFSANITPTYKDEIQRRLEEAAPVGLGPGIPCTGADSLATMSMRAFDAALPLPTSVRLDLTAEAGIPLVSPQGPDLVVETIGCDAVTGLEFRTSNVGTELADGFRNKIVFMSRATGQQVGYPTIPGLDKAALGLGPGESTILSVAVPTACFREDIPSTQEGCDVLIYADSAGAVEEPDDANNMARGRCGT